MSWRKKSQVERIKPILQKRKNSFIVSFHKSLYSESKVEDYLRHTEGIRMVSSRAHQKVNYFKLQLDTDALEECLELLNCIFSLQR